MKEILKRLETAIEASNRADENWKSDPENAEFEETWNECYEAEYKIRQELAAAIVKFSGKQIDHETAMKMTYNPKTWELIKMTA